MINALDDPREIRKLLTEVAYREGRIDGNNGRAHETYGPASVVRHVMNMARAQGYSGEDTMTLLAYHALLRYEAILDQILDTTSMTVSATLLLTPTDATCGGSPTKEL